jgi:cytidine deaminase
MSSSTLSPNEMQLIETAKQTIAERFHEKQHRLATTILTKNGQVTTGINVEGSFGCNDVCAEQIALGVALSKGLCDIETVVTVKHPKPDDENQELRVVSPCGKCRELLNDYAPEAMVILPDGDNHLIKVAVKDLLPNRYSK